MIGIGKEKDHAALRSMGNCLFSPRRAQDRKERVVDDDPAVERGVEGFVRVQGDQVRLLFFIFFFNLFSNQVLWSDSSAPHDGRRERLRKRSKVQRSD